MMERLSRSKEVLDGWKLAMPSLMHLQDRSYSDRWSCKLSSSETAPSLASCGAVLACSHLPGTLFAWLVTVPDLGKQSTWTLSSVTRLDGILLHVAALHRQLVLRAAASASSFAGCRVLIQVFKSIPILRVLIKQQRTVALNLLGQAAGPLFSTPLDGPWPLNARPTPSAEDRLLPREKCAC
jgi:hypothetical protein